jgi:hypothetical protein
MVPNDLIDRWLPKLRGSEVRVLLFLLRKTVGWEDKASPSGRQQSTTLGIRLIANGTGLKHGAITDALVALRDYGLIHYSNVKGCRTSYSVDFNCSENRNTQLFRKPEQYCSENWNTINKIYLKKSLERNKEEKSRVSEALEAYPGEVNPNYDGRMFLSVVHDEDLFFRNLELRKQSDQWQRGYIPKFRNYLRQGDWEIPPRKMPEIKSERERMIDSL